MTLRTPPLVIQWDLDRGVWLVQQTPTSPAGITAQEIHMLRDGSITAIIMGQRLVLRPVDPRKGNT